MTVFNQFRKFVFADVCNFSGTIGAIIFFAAISYTIIELWAWAQITFMFKDIKQN